MKSMSNKAILFNGAALVIVLATAGAMVRSALFHDDAPPCLDRYAKGTVFGLERNGQPLGTPDLQSRVGGTDWGLLEGARVVKLKSGPAPHALEMNLGAVKVRADDKETKPGIGFTWAPRGFERAEAACLAYSVYLGEDFVFGKGGVLPGLFGIPKNDNGEAKDPVFSTRYAWRADGSGDVHTHLPDWPVGRAMGNDRGGFKLDRGRWMTLEQEVVLNDPGQKNGLIRIWVDGALRFEKSQVMFRDKNGDTAQAALAGVLAEVSMPGDTPVAQHRLWISPFELRWR